MGCRVSSSPGFTSGWATWRFGPGISARPAASSTPASRILPWRLPAARRAGAAPRRHGTSGGGRPSRRRARRLARPRPRHARPAVRRLDGARRLRPRRRSTTRAMAVSVLQPARPLPPGLEPVPARPRPGGAPRARPRCGDELRTRRDIYGYDLLAWALHKSGRDAEARAPMRQALALGTRDAMLLLPRRDDRARHSATRRRPRAQLETALAINPSWHPTQPAAARAVLDSLSR